MENTIIADSRSHTLSTNDWLVASKDIVIFAYSDIELRLGGWLPTEADSDQVLRRVSRRRSLPVGENIRDAVRSIKGK